MRRCALTPSLEDALPLSEEIERYLCVVLRLDEGDSFIGFDGQGGERVYRLSRVSGESAVSVAQSSWWAVAEGAVTRGRQSAPVGVCYAVPKGDKIDLVSRQLTELGIDTLDLWSAERSVSVWRGDKAERKCSRLNRVIAEAARQSGRADLLKLSAPRPLKALITRHIDVPLRLFLDPHVELGWPSMEALSNTLNPSLASASSSHLKCVLIVGPEGGISPAEIETLVSAGWIGVALSSPVLRTETAAVVASAIALDRLGYLS